MRACMCARVRVRVAWATVRADAGLGLSVGRAEVGREMSPADSKGVDCVHDMRACVFANACFQQVSLNEQQVAL